MEADRNTIAKQTSRLDSAAETFDTDDVIDRYEGDRPPGANERPSEGRGPQFGGAHHQTAEPDDGQRREGGTVIEEVGR